MNSPPYFRSYLTPVPSFLDLRVYQIPIVTHNLIKRMPQACLYEVHVTLVHTTDHQNNDEFVSHNIYPPLPLPSSMRLSSFLNSPYQVFDSTAPHDTPTSLPTRSCLNTDPLANLQALTLLVDS